jgi:hypothetical protein
MEEILSAIVGFSRHPVVSGPADEDSLSADPVNGFTVERLISYHVAAGKIQIKILSSPEQQPGLGFSAGA